MAWRIFVIGALVTVIAACGDRLGDPTTTGGTERGEDERVRITFERSGGFAGITRRFEVSADDLPPEEADELRRLIDAAGFFDLPEAPGGDGGVADGFTYVIAIEARERTHTVRTSDGTVPEALVPLLDWLNRAARSGGG